LLVDVSEEDISTHLNFGARSTLALFFMRFRSSLLAVITLFMLVSASIRSSAAPAPRPPNIIFFLIDDWGWTDAACYGSKLYETPNIDRLASQGMKFTQAYAACTVCSPTRAAVMTGKYPARLHITDWIAGHRRPFGKLKIPDWTMQLPLEEKTIADELKTRGYRTGSFGKWHLGTEAFYPEHHGFDVNFGGCHLGSPGNYFPPYGIPVIKDEQPGEFLSDRITREAVKFVEANKDRPFYAYIPHYAVHTPLAGKPAVIEKYKKKIAAGNYIQTNPVYAALVESVDDSVGAVVAKLAELKLDDNTIIILTGDNGGLSGTVNAQGWRPGPTRNDPLRLGKGSAYEGGVRVPLIVKWPGTTAAGSVNHTPVISVDFFPTILDIVDHSRPNSSAAPRTASVVDGESITPLLKGGAKLNRDTIYWHYPHYHPGSATPYSAIREGDWKLIHFFEDDHVELYNLKDDLSEKTDLASANAKKVTELRSKLIAWRTAVGAQLPSKNPNFDPAKEWDSERPAEKKGAPKGKKRATGE
jgi:arylsulfatase A-like enzyme